MLIRWIASLITKMKIRCRRKRTVRTWFASTFFDGRYLTFCSGTVASYQMRAVHLPLISLLSLFLLQGKGTIGLAHLYVSNALKICQKMMILVRACRPKNMSGLVKQSWWLHACRWCSPRIPEQWTGMGQWPLQKPPIARRLKRVARQCQGGGPRMITIGNK